MLASNQASTWLRARTRSKILSSSKCWTRSTRTHHGSKDVFWAWKEIRPSHTTKIWTTSPLPWALKTAISTAKISGEATSSWRRSTRRQGDEADFHQCMNWTRGRPATIAPHQKSHSWTRGVAQSTSPRVGCMLSWSDLRRTKYHATDQTTLTTSLISPG